MHLIFLHIIRVEAQAFSHTGSGEIWSQSLNVLQPACLLLSSLITWIFCLAVSSRAEVDNFCGPQGRVPVAVLSPAGRHSAEAF